MAKIFLFLLIVTIFLVYLSVDVNATNGKEIFKKMGCNTCHYEKEEGFSPSIKTISQIYKNKKEQLIKYLKGEAESIVDPDRADFMKPYIKQTKKLENKDLENLIEYLLSF